MALPTTGRAKPTAKKIAGYEVLSGSEMDGKKKKRRRSRKMSGLRSSNPAIGRFFEIAVENAAGIAAASGARMAINTAGKGNKTNLALGHILAVIGGTAYEAFAKKSNKPVLNKIVSGVVIGSGLAMAQNIGRAVGVTSLAGDDYILSENPQAEEIYDLALQGYAAETMENDIAGYELLTEDDSLNYDFDGEDWDSYAEELNGDESDIYDFV